MSNVKHISATALVPFDWLQGNDRLAAEDIAWMAGWLMSPATNLDIAYRANGYVANDRGGQTAMYKAMISGTEAMSYGAIERMADLLRRFDPDAQVSTYDLEA